MRSEMVSQPEDPRAPTVSGSWQGSGPRGGGLEPLDPAVLRDRLRRARVARVGYLEGDEPVIVPVNVAADDEANVVFRTADAGALAGLHGRKVAVEVDGYDAQRRTGWSILVRGVGRDITSASDALATRLRAMPLDCWAPGDRDRIVAVLPVSITSRVISLGADGDWFMGVPSS